MNSSSASPTPTVIYLHGLASSPQSAKASLFRKRFEELGWPCIVPDLNLPAFSSLTLSRGIADVEAASSSMQQNQPILLVGSSFGALTALHAYHRSSIKSRVAALILFAPAFDFLDNKEMRPGDLARWKAAGSASVCHNNQPLSFAFIEDLAQYDSYQVPVSVPCLVIHGRQDQTIGYEQSVRFKEVNPQVQLELLDDTHELLSSFDRIWGEGNNGVAPSFLRSIFSF